MTSTVLVVASSTVRMIYRYPANLLNVFLVPLVFLLMLAVFEGIIDQDRLSVAAGGRISLTAYGMVGLGLASLMGSSMSMAAIVENEVLTGTLAANLAAPLRPLSYVAGLCLASLASGSMLAALLAFIGVAIAGNVAQPVAAAAALGIALAMFFGLGLIAAALAIRFRRIGGTMGSLVLLLQLLTGAFIPLRALPDWLQWLAYALPPTWAIDLTRALLLDVSPLISLERELALGAGLALISCAAGAALVNAAVERVRVRGGLEAY